MLNLGRIRAHRYAHRYSDLRILLKWSHRFEPTTTRPISPPTATTKASPLSLPASIMSSSSDDDEQPPTVFYVDARDGLLGSSADARRKALKHLDYFLEGYCVQIGVDVVKGEDLPYRGLPRKTSNKAVFEFWGNLMGAFVTYLGKHARAACNPKGQRISGSTAMGYLSGVKNYFLDTKFRTEEPVPVFQKAQFRKLTDKLQGLFREANRANGKVDTEDVSSTRQDREAISTACIWMGTPEFAEFWHLSNSSYHCCSRGSETSLIRADGVSCMEVRELTYRYDILSVQLQRQKVCLSCVTRMLWMLR